MSKILVIDDDGVTRLLLKRNLQMQGYDVTLAKNGAEGLRLAKELRPDLIVCDWMMPLVDGVEVCRHIKADPFLATTFFILLTVRGQVDDRIQGLDSGADEFLSKPIESDELLARVRAGLRLHQLTQQLRQANQQLLALVEVQQQLLSAVDSTPEEVNSSYIQLLAPLGQAAQASRAYMSELYQDQAGIEPRVLCEWFAKVPTDNPRQQNSQAIQGLIPPKPLPSRWIATFKKGGIVAGKVSDFPEAEREILEQAHLDSLLMVPLTLKDELVGFIGFENCAIAELDSLLPILRAAAAAICLHRDRSAAVLALRASEARYRAIIEDQTEFICRFAPDGTLTFVNDAYCRYFTMTREELMDGSLVPFRPDFERDFVNQPVINREESALLPNGEVRWHHWTERAVFSGDELVEFQAVGRDITERKQAEEETLKALAKEKELNQLKTHFVSMVSHEFRTPLTTILSSADLLEYYQEDFPDSKGDKKLQAIQRIQSVSVNMTQMIDDILLIGHAESGNLKCTCNPLELVQFCNQLVEDMQFIDNGLHGIELILSQPSLSACMDEKLLRHILTNLLSNALKYSPAGMPVQLELGDRQNLAIFHIKDRGIGIPPKDLPHLFEPFHRCRNVGTISGTGMGLAIVKKCVEIHGGDISVQSEERDGERPGSTTLTVILPRFPMNNLTPTLEDPVLETCPAKKAEESALNPAINPDAPANSLSL
ncbi:hybrid sensor histidine kinase/response regulator [Oscillatoria acuminata]|uniref:histidine kinase n=1 Tax=Oscillatoria acuminata PCC 6304 TaxID=56110 RepID=K9TMI0_9CYAN|nr:response regulator [Oscillatoria acuminata]AFY83750.1 PAS domain S-box [Oscillatoria acuminata PCC 6304]